MNKSARKTLNAIAFAVLTCAAAVVLLIAAERRPADPVYDLAAGLSCPACDGQSVADSDSPVAVSMRQMIGAQLNAGRTPDEVRQWFVGRYGTEVIRSSAGSGWLLPWLLPVGVVAVVGALAYLARHRRSRQDGDQPEPGWLDSHRHPVYLAVAGLGTLIVVGVAVGAAWTDRAPTARPPNVVAAGEVARATESDPAWQLRQAFALLRGGQPQAAKELAGAVRRTHPDDPDAVLILGLAQRASGDSASDQTLRRFLVLAPDHGAAAEIRRLLATGQS
jgi:cytochrome c-type biogenesis protein CcmH/NrfF